MTQAEMVQVDELVREIARALVDEPQAVEVESVNREDNTVLRLRVAAQDVGIDRQTGAYRTFGAHHPGRRQHEAAPSLHPRHP